MHDFVLKLEQKEKESLGTIRCMEGMMVAEADGHIWLKGNAALINLHKSIRQLPIKTTFLLDANKNLFIPGRLTPVAALKEMQWVSLMEFIAVEPPVAALPGKTDSKIRLKLIQSTKERKGTALLTSLQLWKQYAETAPATRLQPLQFAVSEKNEALIIGYPLPSLPGKEYWDTEDVLIPSGYDFELNNIPLFVREKLNKDGKVVFVFNVDGSYQRIEKDFFVPAKRSAIRLTDMVND